MLIHTLTSTLAYLYIHTIIFASLTHTFHTKHIHSDDHCYSSTLTHNHIYKPTTYRQILTATFILYIHIFMLTYSHLLYTPSHVLTHSYLYVFLNSDTQSPLSLKFLHSYIYSMHKYILTFLCLFLIDVHIFNFYHSNTFALSLFPPHIHTYKQFTTHHSDTHMCMHTHMFTFIHVDTIKK